MIYALLHFNTFLTPGGGKSGGGGGVTRQRDAEVAADNRPCSDRWSENKEIFSLIVHIGNITLQTIDSAVMPFGLNRVGVDCDDEYDAESAKHDETG